MSSHDLDLTIYFLAHGRRRYLARTLKELGGVHDDLKSRFQVRLVADANFRVQLPGARLTARRNRLSMALKRADPYLNKVFVMAECETRLMMKCDEDIFMSSATWEAFLTRCLDWEGEDTILAPLISSGIPTVEMFLDKYFPRESRLEIRSEFAKTQIPNIWGADYSSLRDAYDVNDPSGFFQAVSGLSTHYKGVHPIRFRLDLQRQLVDCLISSPSWRIPSSRPSWHQSGAPYFCNSAFVTSAHFYRQVAEAIARKEVFNDGFDEVALNQMLDRTSRRLYIEDSCVAIHPSYNTVGKAYVEVSDYLFNSV